MKKILIWLITIYQKFVSPLFPPRCRFVPSCSEYSIGCLKKYGILLGIIKTLYRIIRCNPFCRGGYDPP